MMHSAEVHRLHTARKKLAKQLNGREAQTDPELRAALLRKVDAINARIRLLAEEEAEIHSNERANS